MITKTMKLVALAIVAALLPARARALAPYVGTVISTATGRATGNLSGVFEVAASSLTASTPTVILDGMTGSVNASSGTLKYGLSAATGSFTATGASQYSVTTSSGISVGAGMVTASGGFNGPVYGNATTATSATSATTATNIASGGIGQQPVQSGSGATTFSPAMGNGGLVIGAGTGAVPSTGTITAGTGISVTNAAGKITMATVGVSSSCSAGQYLQSMVTANGTITGGTCVATGAGDVTQSGNNAFTGNNTHSGQETFNGQNNVVINSTFSVSTYTYLTGDYETTETMGVGLPGSTVTWTASGKLPVMIDFSGCVMQNWSGTLFGVNVLIDGNYVDLFNGTSRFMAPGGGFNSSTRAFYPVNIHYRTLTILSAGSHSAFVSSQGDTGPRGMDCTPGTGGSGMKNLGVFRITETHE